MATEKKTKKSQNDALPPLAMLEVAKLMAKHYGLKNGLYDLVVEFKIGTGMVGPKDDKFPGAMIGVSSLALVPTSETGPLTINAGD
ncbi:MAG: hypothetical protein H6Q00_1638 [Holophagaceae bacterium]|nr:hypothetical protein [Holophagaceae bacterium]